MSKASILLLWALARTIAVAAVIIIMLEQDTTIFRTSFTGSIPTKKTKHAGMEPTYTLRDVTHQELKKEDKLRNFQ